MNVFLIFSAKDSDFFQIEKFTKILKEKNKIKDVFYWDGSKGSIALYIKDKMDKSDVVILFCSESTRLSDAVAMEWEMADRMGKSIIPIFQNHSNIPLLLSSRLGVEFKRNDLKGTIEKSYQLILKEADVKSNHISTQSQIKQSDLEFVQEVESLLMRNVI